MKTVLLRQFNGGIVIDPRDPNSNLARYLTNFDALTNPYKLTPYHDSESGDSASTTSQKQNYCVANYLPGSTNDYRLFSLGVKSGTGLAEVLMKTLTTGGSGDLSDAAWLTPSNNQSASGSTSFNLFTPYKTTGKIYGAAAGTHIWSFKPDGATAFNDSEHSLSYTNISNGLVHSTNDILYIGYDNKIASNNAGVWSDAVLTLPSNLYVTSLAEYGTYLAVLAAPLSGVGSSKIFLWDMSASTWNLMIDNGEGIGKVLGTAGSVLISISTFVDSSRIVPRITFRYYNGSFMETFSVLQGATGNTVLLAKQQMDNTLLFMMKVTLDGSAKTGVWSVSKQPSGYAVVHENTHNNDTALGGGDALGGFIRVGDYLFQSYTASNNWSVSKTNDQASYTATSIYQTTINEGMAPGDKIEMKQLISAGLMYEALPAAGQAVLKYRVDGGSWTTIFTETTDGVVYTEPFPNAGGTQFTKGKEYEFRVESTGGAEITGILYKYSIIPTNV